MGSFHGGNEVVGKLVLIPGCTHKTGESASARREDSRARTVGGKGGLHVMQICLEEEEEACTLEAGCRVPGGGGDSDRSRSLCASTATT